MGQAAKTYRLKVRENGKLVTVGKLGLDANDGDLAKVYERTRRKYAGEVIRIVAPGGSKRNIKPGSGMERRILSGK
jgi:hypothetical protein